MVDVQNKIEEILARRSGEAPKIQQQIDRLEARVLGLRALQNAVDTMRRHDETPSSVRAALGAVQFDGVVSDIANAVAKLSLLKARFGRETLNIGVSGAARVGKSTLLQSISGLTDEQIPTGSGIPVTAVRSQIFHDKVPRATLTMHSYKSFCETVLAPYHDALGLPDPLPQTPEQFTGYPYPQSVEDLRHQGPERSSLATMLVEVREIQASFPSFRDSLTGADQVVPLEDLRRFVAYPSSAARDHAHNTKTPLPQPHYAVQEARIMTPFPHLQVNKLGIVDLPGLGELAPKAHARHLDGLKNSVDLVMVVKRPNEGMAFWSERDSVGLDLIDKARGDIESTRDFAFILINNGDDKLAQNASDLRGDILRRVNLGKDGERYHVLDMNAADRESVYKDALEPVLMHLAERLPVMDQQVQKAVIKEGKDVDEATEALVDEIKSIMRQAMGGTTGLSKREQLDANARTLRSDLSASLSMEVAELQRAARQKEHSFEPAPNRINVKDYETAIEHVYQEACQWADDGFGEGKDAWREMAARRFLNDNNSTAFSGEQFNKVRVEVSSRFSAIDVHFAKEIDNLWSRLTEDVFRPRLAGLLEGYSGRAALEHLSRQMANAEEPCINLAHAIDDLLDLRMSYRTQIHPRVRKEFDELRNQFTNLETGEEETKYTVSLDAKGAARLFEDMAEESKKVIGAARRVMLEESMTPALVIHAAVEQFDDAVVRSSSSEMEFRRLAESYAEQIWPGIFAGADAAAARTNAIKNALMSVEATVTG